MGGKAFDNVEPIERIHLHQITTWIATLFETRKSPDSPEFREFFLGLVSSRSDRNLHESYQNREFSLGLGLSGSSGNLLEYGITWDTDTLAGIFVDNGLCYLGSTGKKDRSGDIDVAVTERNWTYSSLLEFLTGVLPPDNVKGNGSLNQIYTRLGYYPINHDGTLGKLKYVQIDFMVGDVDLLSFTHWSPEYGTSGYSGSHRTELIKAVAKALSEWTLVLGDEHPYNPGEMVGRLGYTLNHDKGLVHGGRFAPKRRDGNGYTKKMIPVTAANVDDFVGDFFPLFFMARYPDEVDAYSKDELITKVSTDPVFIAQQLFGIGVKPESLNSYEQVVEAILANDELVEDRDLIWKLFVERLVQIGQPIPELSLNDLFTIRRLNGK